MGLYDRADMRFIWNGFLLKSFQKFDLKKYCLPIIMGFVSVNQVNVNGNNFSWILISRRSIQRAGTRLFCRGIDQNVSILISTIKIQFLDKFRERLRMTMQ